MAISTEAEWFIVKTLVNVAFFSPTCMNHNKIHKRLAKILRKSYKQNHHQFGLKEIKYKKKKKRCLDLQTYIDQENYLVANTGSLFTEKEGLEGRTKSHSEELPGLIADEGTDRMWPARF